MSDAEGHGRAAIARLLSQMPADLGGLALGDLTLDSRQIAPGDVFVAVPGAQVDGRDYVDDALARGASLVLAEAKGLSTDVAGKAQAVHGLAEKLPDFVRDFYGDPSRTMQLVAVTGTNGKTSVTDFVMQLLNAMGVAAGCIGTLGARLDADCQPTLNTTPDVISLNRQLARWQERGVATVALEASSHALSQDRLKGLTLHTGVFTNLSRDHLDYHGDERRYALAKLSLFSDFPLRRALYNADDPVCREVPDRVQCPTLGLSQERRDSDVFLQLQSSGPLTFRLHSPSGTATVTAGLSGSFNAFNLAAAVMAVVGLGWELDAVVRAAEGVRPVPGRMDAVENSEGFRVVVDYAHTPDALARALIALRGETSGLLWVVFGCGGDRDRGKRPQMGAQAARLADRLVVTSDNPRSESEGAIIDDILSGIDSGAAVIPDRREAIEHALDNAAPGDTVIVAGKGHEAYQEVAGECRDFSDREVIQAWFSERAA